MEKLFTRRQFAMGSATALGAIATSGMASAGPSAREAQEAFDPFETPAGEKQFIHQNIKQVPRWWLPAVFTQLNIAASKQHRACIVILSPSKSKEGSSLSLL